MISKTKYPVAENDLRELFIAAGIEGVSQIYPLGAGEYNAVFAASAGAKDYVVKIAPADSVPVLTYEKNMIESEVFWYKQMRENTSIRVPEIYRADFEQKAFPFRYIIMERLPGEQLDKMIFSAKEKAETAVQTAKMAAQIHAIKNDRFGYVQNKLFDNWYQAIRSMVKDVIRDAQSQGKHSKRGKRLLRLIDLHRRVLEQAECCMVNFDIWAPNILCTRQDGEIRYAWIDPERSFWGDRICDFVCLEMMTPFARKTKSLAAYNAVAKEPVLATREEEIRYGVALGYLGLVMEVEKYFRYTPRHFGWWRNIASSAGLFHQAFGVLEKA